MEDLPAPAVDFGCGSQLLKPNTSLGCADPCPSFKQYIMPQSPLRNSNFSYTHNHHKETPQAVDVHDIFIAKSRVRVLLSYLGILLFLAIFCCSLPMQESFSSNFIWSTSLGALLAKALQYKPVKKESIVILPAFGVQLETHFWSGKVVYRFVPMGKILRPVLNECVTPVTCYWSLAFILREEEELMLVFKESRPPLKILVPVWKGLCAAIDCKG